jgi:hypothetical protein
MMLDQEAAVKKSSLHGALWSQQHYLKGKAPAKKEVPSCANQSRIRVL